MKKVLCFGDSNVYGYNPYNGQQYDIDTRWTGVLRYLAAGKYDITEAGFNNRTCFAENKEDDFLIGYKALPQYLIHEKYHCIILAIGINDLQTSYNITPKDLGDGLHRIIQTAYKYNPNTKIIVVAPSVISEDILKSGFATMFDETSIEKSKELGKIYKEIAETNDCEFVNLNNYVKPSSKDGLHYEEDAHREIARVLLHSLYKVFIK